MLGGIAYLIVELAIASRHVEGIILVDGQHTVAEVFWKLKKKNGKNDYCVHNRVIPAVYFWALSLKPSLPSPLREK